MGDTAVDLLINKLLELSKVHIDLLHVVKDDLKSLTDEVMSLQTLLNDAKRISNRSETRKYHVRKVTTAATVAENSIDKFLIVAMKRQKKKLIVKLVSFPCYYRSKLKCAAEIRSITKKLKSISEDSCYDLMTLPCVDPKHNSQQLRRAPVTEEDEVVGFDEEAKTIIDRLIGGSDDLEVIPIVGMPGLGKTTIARKIFKNPKVELVFGTRIWVYVSQSYTQRDLFLNIISQFTRNTEQYRNVPEGKLAKEVFSYFPETKFLIVLDDVWTSKAWNDVKTALPNNLKGSRVLLTTRDSMVANDCCNNSPHQLKFLTDDECCELLQKKVFRKDKYPPDLEDLGKDIAKKCRGLPLATLVIAGILRDKGKTKSEWERVYQDVSEHIISNDLMAKKFVQMSYDSLPFNLKVCFLYCGVFPRGSEIPAWKLVRLWIAEGFIEDRVLPTPETLAEEYLNALVSKSLLLVTRRTSNGQIKTCRMHDILHEFCRLEASEENLFKEIKLGVKQSFPRKQELATLRRISIDSSFEEFSSTKPYGDSIRSFLCFSSQKIKNEKEIKNELGTIPKSFPLLRVFDIESISFGRFHKQFSQLYHLRYIAVSSNSLKILPKFMENLCNLQMLIIVTQAKTLDIQADICNMPRLRHLHTNASAKLCSSAAVKSNKHEVEAHALQTLSTIEPESCTEHVLARCQNLKKLGIRGKKAELVEPSVNANPKLMNDYPLEVGKLHLPSANTFPKSLKKVTLSDTKLTWADMVKLELLPAVEVLKLKEHAFMGDYWESKDDAFPCLRVLWIERTDLVNWKVSSGAFRSLERLVLHHLVKLEEVPIELANISNLQMIELKNTTRTAVESAEKIRAKRAGTGLKLSINLPDL